MLALVGRRRPIPRRCAALSHEPRHDSARSHAGIHAAGIIDDAPMHGKERQSLEAVLRPKVAGAIALVEALRGKPLDFLALFSSSSAALGPAGQTDYVAANAFLNAYARQLAAEGVPARAVQWGAWREVGMAVAALAPAPLAGSEKVDHPLLQRRADVGARRRRCSARISTRGRSGCSTSIASAAPSRCFREPGSSRWRAPP